MERGGVLILNLKGISKEESENLKLKEKSVSRNWLERGGW